MELRKLHHAVVLSRHLNFGRAAEALNLTQSALSRSIQALEEECGLRLFDRNRNMIVVTAVGRDFLRHAEALLRKETELLDMVRHAAGGEGGTVAIGMAPLAVRTLLVPLMRDLVSAPGFHAQVQVGSQDKLIGLLRDEIVDFCVCTGNTMPETSLLSCVPLACFPVALVVRSGHPLAGNQNLHEDDVASFPLLRSRPFDQGIDETISIEHMLHKRPTLAVDDYHVLRHLTLASDAIWITSSIAVREWLRDGNLVEILVRWSATPRQGEMFICHLTQRTLAPLAEHIIAEIGKLCRTQFGQM